MEGKNLIVKNRGRSLMVATLFGASFFSYANEADYKQLQPAIAGSEYEVDQQKSKRVSGTVSDETGLPMIGVNVVQKGTTNGVITDMDGNGQNPLLKSVVWEHYWHYRHPSTLRIWD